eukprot:TRINITY_DN30232_c0_g1_i1.p1 TRINITY_DN30232_c0_g1~~TRINITY_DN30232_c0_g1_i1.p1  ORF type:complete len:117 (-),score=26.19 TRINITY_DN30232_c0_g1_i1:170-496(-)
MGSDQSTTRKTTEKFIHREMSSLTDEWYLKTQDNCIKYIMDIRNFDRKVKTFRVGREIHSKRFKIGSATFNIEIFPGGILLMMIIGLVSSLLIKATGECKQNAYFHPK